MAVSSLLNPALNTVRSNIRPLDAPVPFRLWHLLSLDAPTVAVVWALGFTWAAGTSLPAWIPIVLALVTWVLYVADRLLDAHSDLGAAESGRLRLRHRFHWRYRRFLAPFAIAAACAALWTVYRLMPPGPREKSLALAFIALAYFSSVHFGRWTSGRTFKLPPQLLPKELIVGFLFTAGCVLPTLNRIAARSGSVLGSFCAIVLYFALLAWLNCYAIDRWETANLHSQIAFAACLLGVGGLIFLAVLFFIQPRMAALLAAGIVSVALLGFLDRIRDRLTPLALRVAADLVLLTPLLLLALGINEK